ncbi:hypothetical protein CVT24_010547 [Panaeolus cyanescens]|uniref:Cupin-like domain-containing protein n=1 Tax=Panaeolus cyanescens TaxID=181874 RepID=A0A409YYI8_9AGAR|nr:hypothetical protein CVT24_010547 [Panaeolus cyanescens]
MDICYDRMRLSRCSESLFEYRESYINACILKSLALSMQSRTLDAIGTLDRAFIIGGAGGDEHSDIVYEILEKLQASYHFPNYNRSPEDLLCPDVHVNSNPTSIPYIDPPPSLLGFQKHESKNAFILKNFAADWPALTTRSWNSVDYLRSVAGPGRIVPVEVGHDYRKDDWSQELMPWDTFLNAIKRQDPSLGLLYLAQYNLFKQFPALRDDISIPDYVYLDIPDSNGNYESHPRTDDGVLFNIWLGPKGAMSPAHTDPYFNFYVQVAGSKTVWLAPPSVTGVLSVDGDTASASTPTQLTNTSNIDVFSTNLSEDHPEFIAKPTTSRFIQTHNPFHMFVRDDEDEGTSPFHTALTLEQIDEALDKSPDGGCTILLAKLQITEIKPSEVKAIANLELGQECALERLALGNNRLFDLPLEFSLLNRLRYLNLKHNCISSVPEVLTQMPALDTLDLSHNKIVSLPSQPGTLLQLRVFSLTKNKLSRIPTYLSRFRELEVLRIDRNPLEYPPKAVMMRFEGDMGVFNDRDQVHKLQSWLDSDNPSMIEYDDSGYTERVDWDLERHTAGDSWQHDDTGSHVIPHSRTLSSDSRYTPIFDSPVANTLIIKPLDSPTVSLSDTHSPFVPNSSQKLFGLSEVEPLHLRTVSHGSTLHKPTLNLVSSKKSLPDLRMAEQRIQHSSSTNHAEQQPVLFSSFGRRDVADTHQQPSMEDPRFVDAHVPLMTVERNSYFRRSAAIFVNRSLPPALMHLLETARSILFAMSQLYQSLEHYSSHVVNDRLSNLFKKVLDPANISMLHLIRSLDRFDDVSQSSMPSSAVCRALVESCRDTISIFRKAINLMTLQIGLEPPDDVRYMRWLVLELYGTSVEICSAWQGLLPYIESLKPQLHGSTFVPTSVYGSDNLEYSEGFASGEQMLAPAVRLRPLDSTQSTGRLRTTRRHAGSFSSKDVQIGKELPSYDLVPNTPGGHHTPALRTPKRQITVPVLSSSTPTSSIDATHGIPRFTNSKDLAFDHRRQGSQLSMFDIPGLPIGSPVATKIRVSQDVLQAVREAVQIAPPVWQMIEDAMSREILAKLDLKDNLETARFVTKKLNTMLAAFDDKDAEFDINLLREHGHLFLRTLVRLSNILKQSGEASPSLKASMVKLTNATENFAILLHVSSSPPETSGSTRTMATLQPTTDHSAPSGLFRSKSAQPSIGSVSKTSIFPGP